jgi:hypothetical protein
MFYMLQSFNLKLLDTGRRDVIQKARAGDYKGATKAATTLGGYFILMNGSVDQFKNFVRGKELEPVQDIIGNNMLRMFGLNKFVGDQVMNEGLGKAAMGIIAPPTAVLDDPSRVAKFGGVLDRFME